MKKSFLAQIALLSVGAFTLMAVCTQQPPAGGAGSYAPQGQAYGPQGGRGMYGAYAQGGQEEYQAFYARLSPDSQKKYDQLDARHKRAAMDDAHQGQDANRAVENHYNDQMKNGQGKYK